jgi:recombination protein RecA
MAKKKQGDQLNNLDAEYAALAEETGGDTLDQLESVRFYIDTGNLAINYSCSGKFIIGGLPGGRIIEAFGPEASGKSLIGANGLFGCQQMDGWAILLDCENASNGEFMQKVSHLNLKRVLRYAPSSLERAFRQIHVAVKAIRDRDKELKRERKPIYVMFDSLTVPPCERELRENNLPMDFSPTEWKKIVGRQEQPGERARIISAEMRKLQSMVAENDVTVYLINQVRDKIGVLYGSPETTPGGNAVKFYASLRFRTQAKKKIEHAKLEKFAGINMQVRNVKNRTCRPFIIADDVKLYFEEGVDPLSGLLNPLLESERIVQKGAGNYEVAKDYLPDTRTEYKFKAAKAENRVPVAVLMDCPKLIDGTCAEDVQGYLDKWGGGLFATESGDFREKPVNFDLDGNPVEAELPDDEKDEETLED